MPKLKLNSKAPDFKLKDKKADPYSLNDFDTDYKVIFFYPKDDTPGCTIEAKGFNKDLAKFKKLSVAIVGISGGDEKTKEKFCKKYQLKITLLSDPDFKICKKYGSYGKKTFMGKTYNGILRKTFILNDKNKVIKIYDKVTPDIHSEEIIDFINSL